MKSPSPPHLKLLNDIALKAREAYRVLATTDSQQKNRALLCAAELIRQNQAELLVANKEDLRLAKANGIRGSFLDRLELTAPRIEGMATGLEAIAELDNPVGQVLSSWERPNGLEISRVSIPLGVIGIIYESRPNVTADASALCLKSGNAAILRCGSDSVNSSRLIAQLMKRSLQETGLPPDSITLLPTQDREAVGTMLGLRGLIDVVIPRGGKSLIERVVRDSKIPTFEHLDGNCHTYLHRECNLDTAVSVVQNAKLRRTGVCGATESLVIDEFIIDTLLPKLIDAMPECEFRGDSRCLNSAPGLQEASPEDWGTEYLAPILSVKTVSSFQEAITHINLYGSGHTDAIITENEKVAQQFLSQVDSAIVVHNASTQFLSLIHI